MDWRLDNLKTIGGEPVTVVGTPRLVQTVAGPALEFNGSSDGIFLDVNPLAGLQRFTVEVLFEPAPDGPPEQRFLHFEEKAGDPRRALMETRMLPGGHWALDTFLRDGDIGATLLNRELAHPAGEWHTAALVYDGTVMSHYVDGVRENAPAGEIVFGPMAAAGRTSIGVRQNKVYWFKGRIARVRVTAGALGPDRFISRPGEKGPEPRAGLSPSGSRQRAWQVEGEGFPPPPRLRRDEQPSRRSNLWAGGRAAESRETQ